MFYTNAGIKIVTEQERLSEQRSYYIILYYVCVCTYNIYVLSFFNSSGGKY